MLRLGLAVLAASLLLVAAPAQIRVRSPQPTMLATDEYLFVMRGHEIFQFDIDTLKLLHRAELPPDPDAGEELEPVEEAVEEEEPILQDAEFEPGDGAGGKYGGRRGGTTELTQKGTKVTAESISSALRWLATHQGDDGRWNADEFMQHDADHHQTDGPGHPVHDVGLTGLALLAFLGDGNTMRTGPYRDSIKRAMAWLRGQQDPKTGLIGTNNSVSFIYNHSIATLAMVEAYGLSGHKSSKKSAQRAIDYLEWHRNPYAVWRYQPRDGDNDTSVTTWCVMAYRSAADFGLEVDEQALKIAASWFDQMTDPVSGRTGYIERGGSSSRKAGDHAVGFPRERNEAMTAATLFCRFLLGQHPEQNPLMLTQADLVLAKAPVWDEGSIDECAWLFGSFALYQVGGHRWKDWSRALTKALLKNQRRDDNFAGSWDPVGVWGEEGGRVYSTAMFCLALQTYYRYARLVR